MNSVNFYFDFSSPNAYFSSVQLDRYADEKPNLKLNWRPVYLGGIMKELETTPPAMQSDLKAEYMMKDLERWSEKYEIPFGFPDQFPIDSLKALRSYLVLKDLESGNEVAFARDVFRRYWVEGKDISELPVLEESLSNTGNGGIDLELAINDESVKNELKKRTDRAMDRGVFGCPTFIVDDELHWGKDRLDFVKDYLENKEHD